MYNSYFFELCILNCDSEQSKMFLRKKKMKTGHWKKKKVMKKTTEMDALVDDEEDEGRG